MHQYFLLQNASICTISTHFALIFLCKMRRHCQRILLQKKNPKCYNCNIGAKCVVTMVTSSIPVGFYDCIGLLDSTVYLLDYAIGEGR